MTGLSEKQNDKTANHSLIGPEASHNLGSALNAMLADCFALYLKSKNFHWHMSGANFRDYHLLLDDHAGQIFAMTDPIAERVRKLGRQTLHSISAIAALQRVLDNNANYVPPHEMLAELRDDNLDLSRRLRELHSMADEEGDFATASLVEVWLDETESRHWYLYEATR